MKSIVDMTEKELKNYLFQRVITLEEEIIALKKVINDWKIENPKEEFKVGWVYKDSVRKEWLVLKKDHSFRSLVLINLTDLADADPNTSFRFVNKEGHLGNSDAIDALIFSTGRKWEPEE